MSKSLEIGTIIRDAETLEEFVILSIIEKEVYFLDCFNVDCKFSWEHDYIVLDEKFYEISN